MLLHLSLQVTNPWTQCQAFSIFGTEAVFVGFRTDPRLVHGLDFPFGTATSRFGNREAHEDLVSLQCLQCSFVLKDFFLHIFPGELLCLRNAYICANCVMPTGARPAWE